MKQIDDYTLLEPSRKGFVANYPPFRYWKKLEAAEMIAPRTINIYVHIPFCIQRCAYCYYRTTNLKGTELKQRLERYVSTLCREIEMASQHFQLQERPVVSIYFGGGTPTLLKEEQLERIVECLHKNLRIETPEFTVEAEPVTLTKKKAATLKNLKVNRISMGVQSLCDDIIKQSHRLDTEQKALNAIELAKATGAVVNIDLLSGLAGETPETWKYSVNRAIESGVHSITVYKMELYANSEYYMELRNQQIELPSDEQELEFMRYAMAQFEQVNYLPWSFFTFTRDGQYEHQYATSIWRGTDCYPFGVSAFGELGNWLFQNTNAQEKYESLIESGQLPINRGYQLTGWEQMIRAVALGMKLVRLDLQEFHQKYGVRLETLCAASLEYLEQEGFIAIADDALTLTPKGILYGDYSGKVVSKQLEEMAK